MKVNVVIVAQQCLSYAQKEEMWAVYKNYYHYSRSYVYGAAEEKHPFLALPKRR